MRGRCTKMVRLSDCAAAYELKGVLQGRDKARKAAKPHFQKGLMTFLNMWRGPDFFFGTVAVLVSSPDFSAALSFSLGSPEVLAPTEVSVGPGGTTG